MPHERDRDDRDRARPAHDRPGELPGDPVRSVVHDRQSCAASHVALVDALRALTEIDPSRPTRLAGWSAGHVLSHIARNADSHRRLLAGQPQYVVHGARDAAIEAGAGRAWEVLVDDVERSGLELDRAYAEFDEWERLTPTAVGTRPAYVLPLLRQREVEIHRVDLGVGYEFADLPSDYVRRELRLLEMLWAARRPMGMTRLPAAALERPPSERLAWMLGRVTIDGAGSADLI